MPLNFTALYVATGLSVLAAICAAVGTFALLRGRALVGDAIAHAVLPGVCLAFLVQGTKDPLALLLGAFASGFLAQLITDWLPRHTRVKTDTAVALVLSVFFGAGTVLLTYIQGSGVGAQSGLDRFLFGQAAALTPEEVRVFVLFALGAGAIIVFAYPGFKLLTFDPSYATSRGLPVRGLQLLLTTLTVLAVVLGIQAVGVVLLSALLITPVAAGRLWQVRLVGVIVASMLVAVLSVWLGVFVSATIPRMPTGPWVVVTLTLITLLSLILSPRKGLVSRYIRHKKQQARVAEENILKAIYHLQEATAHGPVSAPQLIDKRPALARHLGACLGPLVRKQEIRQQGESLELTETGLTHAKALVRRHRLWELYLARRLQLPDDQLHADAEVVEHLLTPELEAELELQLQYPTHDPHQKQIPY